MALTKLNAVRAITGATPVANGGTALTSGFVNGGALAEADNWRLTSGLAAPTTAAAITANLERVDSVSDKVGTGMSQSSGVFTFPSTGIWLVRINAKWAYAGNDVAVQTSIYATTDNSSYTEVAMSHEAITQISSSTTRAMGMCEILLDVASTTNTKVKFYSGSDSGAAGILEGDTDKNRTTMMFLRIGDT